MLINLIKMAHHRQHSKLKEILTHGTLWTSLKDMSQPSHRKQLSKVAQRCDPSSCSASSKGELKEFHSCEVPGGAEGRSGGGSGCGGGGAGVRV